MADKWMQSAVKRPGALRAKADKAGESTQEYAREHKSSPGRTGKQARLALTFAKARKGKRKGRSSSRKSR